MNLRQYRMVWLLVAVQFNVSEDDPTHHLHCKYLGTGIVCGYSFIHSFKLEF